MTPADIVATTTGFFVRIVDLLEAGERWLEGVEVLSNSKELEVLDVGKAPVETSGTDEGFVEVPEVERIEIASNSKNEGSPNSEGFAVTTRLCDRAPMLLAKYSKVCSCRVRAAPSLPPLNWCSKPSRYTV
jgi:hypothetical protein